LAEIRNEPAFEEFLQYITMTGPVNLRLVAPEKWFQFKEVIYKD